MTRTFVLAIGLIAAATYSGMSASVPVGVYAIVDKVVLEPGDGDPQRIQIWGTFAVWDDTAGPGYRTPQRGYLYYGCSREQLGTCRNEWGDLRSVAGTGRMIGFGSRSLAAGRIRPAGERTSAPEVYPIQFGVVEMGPSPRGAIFDQLKAVARAR